MSENMRNDYYGWQIPPLPVGKKALNVSFLADGHVRRPAGFEVAQTKVRTYKDKVLASEVERVLKLAKEFKTRAVIWWRGAWYGFESFTGE